MAPISKSIERLAATEPVAKPTFMTLPAEIRTQIYTWLVHMSNDDDEKVINAHLNRCDIVDCRFRSVMMRKDPHTQSTFPRVPLYERAYHPYSMHAVARIPFGCGVCGGYLVGLLHQEPAIWKVNRQIREEARWEHITRCATIDVRGDGDSPADSWRGNLGLRCAEEWSQGVGECHRRGITRLVVRDWVKVVSADGIRRPTPSLSEDALFYRHLADAMAIHLNTAPDYENAACPWFYTIMSVFEFAISNNGKTMTIRTPFKLITTQVTEITSYLHSIAEQRASKVFNGEDILKAVRFLRTSSAAPFMRVEWARNAGEPTAVRFCISADESEADFESQKLLYNAPEFKYVVGQASVFGAKESGGEGLTHY